MGVATAAPSGAARWTEIDWAPHVHSVQVEGRRLGYVDYGDGPPLLLVHGLGGSWQTWLENIPTLGQRNRVIAVDLPGFGASEALPPRSELVLHVEALAALLDDLGVERILLVGHSLGGLVSLQFARAHLERLSGLVLVDSGGVSLSPRRLALIVRAFTLSNAMFKRPGVARAFARRPRLRRAMLRPFVGDPRSLSPELAAEVVPLAAAPGFADAVVAGASAATSTAATEVNCPTLLIWGSRDRILPLTQARELARTLPDARLEALEGVGHCPMFERPSEFNALLESFAAENPARAA